MVATPLGSPRMVLLLLLGLTAATFFYLLPTWQTTQSLVIHLANVALAFLLFSETMPLAAATIGTAIFAIHPVQAEAVALASGRAELIATGLALLSTQAWRRRRHALAAVWFIAAVAVNPALATLPVFFLLVEHSYGFRRQGGFMAFCAMMLASFAALVHALVTDQSFAETGLLDRMLSAAPILGRFAALIILPSNFSIWPDVDQSALARFAAWMALAALCGAALTAFGRLRLGFWFLAAIVLVAPSFALFAGPEAASDRRLYLPLLAIAAVAGRLLESTKFPLLLGAGLALLVGLNLTRATVWQSERAAWEEAAQRSPTQLRPRLELARLSPPRAALELLLETKALYPGEARVAARLGSTYLALHLPGAAVEELSRALVLQPGSSDLHLARGLALAALQLHDDALTDFETAAALDPCSAGALAALYLPTPAGCGK